MAIQNRPPDWRRVLAKDPEEFFRLANSRIGDEVRLLADRRDKYLTWDQFRRRPMPGGISQEQGWALVKFGRQSGREPAPFQTEDQASPHLVISNPLRACLRRIDLHRGLTEAGLPDATSSDTRTFGFRAAIEEAFSSSRIEGADSTRERARELIRKKGQPQTRAERMIMNNYSALRELDEWTTQPLTPELLLHIHEIVTKDALEDPADSGRFRADDDVRVRDRISGEVVHIPPPAGSLHSRITTLCDFANREISDEEYLHPLIRASLLHYQLAYDHPFGDGNGRTARWLFFWSMQREPEYWWFRFLSVSRMIDRAREQYYRAFQHTAEDDFDLTYFVRFQVRCVEIEMERFQRFLERREELRESARKSLRLDDQLNVRQLALFDYLSRHPQAEFSQREHAQFHDVSPMTASRDLNDLVEHSLLERVRDGKSYTYQPTSRFRRLALATRK